MKTTRKIVDTTSTGRPLLGRGRPSTARRKIASPSTPLDSFAKILCALLIGLLVNLSAGPWVYAQSPGPASSLQEGQPLPEEVTPDPWPKVLKQGGATYTIFQPQLDSWDMYRLEAHAAVSVLSPGAKDPVFGVIEITAATLVHRQARTVEFTNITVAQATFPSVPDKAAQYQKAFQTLLAKGPSTMSLDRLQAALAIQGAEQKAKAVPVKNEPPQFIFKQTVAILVTIDGEPVWTAVPSTPFQRILNTRALILKDASGTLYLHLFNGFLQASSLAGPWTVAKPAPSAAGTVAQQLAKEGVVDLMEGTPNEQTKQKPSLAKGAPEIIVATVPTELLVTEGPPEWVPVEGTLLLYVSNTTGNIFKDLNDQTTYLLVTGRWFRAPDFSGPWQYVPGTSLPPDFAQIPDTSPKENVKASVPGTPQARIGGASTCLFDYSWSTRKGKTERRNRDGDKGTGNRARSVGHPGGLCPGTVEA